MNPFSVAPVTIPRAQRISRIRKMVQSMADSPESCRCGMLRLVPHCTPPRCAEWANPLTTEAKISFFCFPDPVELELSKCEFRRQLKERDSGFRIRDSALPIQASRVALTPP